MWPIYWLSLVHTKFQEDWLRYSSNIKVLPQQLRACDIGITDGKDLGIAPLRWTQIPWYE
jgi:hypothetical protein